MISPFWWRVLVIADQVYCGLLAILAGYVLGALLWPQGF